MEVYLLEKSRITYQTPNERCFHIFYNVMSDAIKDLKSKFAFGFNMYKCVCVCVCVCVRAILRIVFVCARVCDREKGRERVKEGERDNVFVCVCVFVKK